MTETSVRSEVISGDANLVGNVPLEELMFANLAAARPPVFDDADRAMARRFQQTMSSEDISSSYARFGLKPKKDQPLCDEIFPLFMPATVLSWALQMSEASAGLSRPCDARCDLRRLERLATPGS